MQAAGGFLTAEPGAFHPTGQAPVAAGVQAQVGIGQHDRLTDEQIAEAKAFGGAA